MNLVLLGAPGAGKGTQAQKLVAEYGVAHISTGDLLRAAVKAQSELGKQAKAYMDEGKLVPDQLVIDLVKERLQADDAQKGFILDGFPRNTAQATTLDAELEGMGIALDGALLVDVAFPVIIERLSSRRTCRDCSYTAPAGTEECPRCGGEMYQRDDDKPETIQKRLDTYQAQTAPLIEYYDGKNILIKVDGDRPVDEVYVDVKKGLGL
ncbi:MAG: adenylate kinase [Atopobiaceae bacterium]|nr:adenylate kinase [Atopobiaceae bacterium]